MSAEYLDAFRRSIATPEGAVDRNRTAIATRIAHGDVAERVDEAENDPRTRAPTQPRGRWAAALFLGKAVSLSVALGVAGLGAIKVGAMTWSAIVADDPRPAATDTAREVEAKREARAKRAAPPTESTAAPAETATPPPVESVVLPPVAIEEPPPAATETKGASLPRATRAPAKGASDLLREEVDLMTRAEAELDAGRHEALLDLLARHEKRFPAGAMIEERLAWRAIAACSLARQDARAQAQTFLARHAGSSLAEKVRRACSDRPTDPAARSD